MSPSVVALLVVTAGGATAIHLAVSPDPFSGPSAAVIAIGIVLYTTISVTGIMLVRARWSRRLAMVTLGLDLIVVAISGMGTVAWIALAAALAGLAGLSGRWLDGWFRMRSSATGPDARAVILVLGLLGLVPAVGLCSPLELTTAHGVLGAAGVFLSWAYSKAQVWSLWAIRLVLPLVAVPALMSSPWPGAITLAALTAGLVILSWTREAMLAVRPMIANLPGPRKLRPQATDTDPT